MENKIKIGFIGCGNMAKPIIKGIINCGLESYDEAEVSVFVYDINREMLNDFCEENDAVAVENYSQIISECETVVLAVKPQVFPELLSEIKDELRQYKPFVVSIAAGKTIEYIESFIGGDMPVGRIFPNLNAEVCEAVSAFCCNKNASEREKNNLKDICFSYGEAIALEEDKFSVFGVLSGCAPAYTFMYIDALAKAAVANGFDEETSLMVASQMAYGSALMLRESKITPEELIKKVCSPGGTTIEGVTYLSDNGFENTVKNAFNASFNKDKKL